MRIVWAAVIWVIFTGGLMSYMVQRGSGTPAPTEGIKTEAARGVYTLSVTATFTAEPDPFALESTDPLRLSVLALPETSNSIRFELQQRVRKVLLLLAQVRGMGRLELADLRPECLVASRSNSDGLLKTRSLNGENSIRLLDLFQLAYLSLVRFDLCRLLLGYLLLAFEVPLPERS